jgi:hypothetical protein
MKSKTFARNGELGDHLSSCTIRQRHYAFMLFPLLPEPIIATELEQSGGKLSL